MDSWLLALILYAALALLTLAPALIAALSHVKLHPGGSSFEDSPLLSEKARKRLEQHFSRLQGTLGFWKKRAETYKKFHYYSLCWTIPSSVIIPFLVQAVSNSPYSKWFVTVVSAHTAILLAFHKGLKVDANFKAFRQGESEFYDLYRRMLDRPQTFGGTEEEQLANYFDAVENVRKYVRNAEIDNLPSMEGMKAQLSDGDKAQHPASASDG